MIGMSDKLIGKLKRLAEVVDAEKHLYFFAVLQHELMPDRWDILVSAKELKPWSADAIDYMADLLKRELTKAEMIQIAQVAVLPRDNEWVVALSRNGKHPAATAAGRSPITSDAAVVIWPVENSLRPARIA